MTGPFRLESMMTLAHELLTVNSSEYLDARDVFTLLSKANSPELDPYRSKQFRPGLADDLVAILVQVSDAYKLYKEAEGTITRTHPWEDYKPNTVGSKMAEVFLHLLSLSGEFGIDLFREIVQRINYLDESKGDADGTN